MTSLMSSLSFHLSFFICGDEIQRQLTCLHRGEKAAKGGSLIGLELLLIEDEQGTVIVSSSHSQYTCRFSNHERLFTIRHPIDEDR
ncbi:hypothetical protein Bca101_070353 [Brassica carinata]